MSRRNILTKANQCQLRILVSKILISSSKFPSLGECFWNVQNLADLRSLVPSASLQRVATVSNRRR